MPVMSCCDSEEGPKCIEEGMGKITAFFFFSFIPHQLISVRGVTSAQVLQIRPNYTQ